MHRAAALWIVVFSLLTAAAANAIPISELHENNSSIVPNKTGLRFPVTGIVTSPDSVRSDFNTEVMIQDATGGITLFQAAGIGPFHFNLGDSVTVEGTVTHFNGLTELGTLGGYVLHSTGNFAVDPLVLTCAQVNATLLVSSPDSFPEFNESRLVRINNVTRTAGTWPTTCLGANTTLTIQDASGSTTLFIDKDSEACGSSDPSGPFDVVGLLSQYDTSAPYSTGYQIVPRFKTDIVPLTPGPNFTSSPQAEILDSTIVRITWGTDVASTSLVVYGLTTAYGSAVGDSTPVADHGVLLTGLTPGKLYHYRVASTDAQGTRLSGDFIFVTPSSTPGAMNFYFSKTIDASLAYPDVAQGEVYLLTPVLARIAAATSDISVAVYSFSITPLTNALLAAKDRGVKVRLIMDAGAASTEANRLVAQGIPVITSTYGGNHLSGGIHHNKFFAFDARDADSSNDWVWTGSVNMSDENMADANNGIEIQDYGLAQAYLTEFNEEWGSATDTPSAATSRMGNRKADNTPHHFVINGIDVDLYFSPSDCTESRIVNAIGTADSSVCFSILVLTSDPIADAMRNKFFGISGFDVRGVFDNSNINQAGSEWPEMSGTGGTSPWNPPADVHADAEAGLIHHKYAIIDQGYPALSPMVVTGSHNWSNAANTENDENTLVFHDARIANLYTQEFAMRYRNSGGLADLQVVGVGDKTLAGGLRLSSPYPNPAAGGAVVEFALPGGVSPGQKMSLKLYDLQGRLVKTLVEGPAVAGPQRVSVRAEDGDGVDLASGVYFLRLEAQGGRLSQKWVVLK